MKKNFFLFVILFLGSFLVTQTACNSDKCKDKDCGNGICLEDGACDCDAGYEYDANGLCNVLVTDKFVGTYTVSEDCANSPATSYNVTAVAGSTLGTVNFSGFYGPSATGGFIASVVATVSGNEVTIARQEPDGDDFFVVGSGTYDPTTKKITMSYTVTNETNPASIVSNACNSVIFTKL